MNYAQIRSMDISNGEGIGVSLFVSGCDFHCKNCFNKETWNYDYGKPFTKEVEKKLFELISKPHIKRVSILGGSPLANKNVLTVYHLIRRIKDRFPTKKIWVYTGYKYESIINCESVESSNVFIWKKARKEILKYIDYLVDGQYVDELHDFSLKFRGSKNQRVIDVQKSLANNKAVLYID